MRLRREYLSNPQFFDKYISETIIKFRPSCASNEWNCETSVVNFKGQWYTTTWINITHVRYHF